MRIVFMGTPDFAVESLKVLLDNNYHVAAVVTMPDKPAGRGHKTQYSAVKKFALEHQLPLLQPENLKSTGFLEQLRTYKADLQIVVAFRMLPEVVWAMPPLGTFNLHASLLPQYRGAAPINWAIINGEKETGVTTFFLSHEIDAGHIILQEKIAVEPDDDAGILHDKLMLLGAQMVKKTVELIEGGKLDTIDQSSFIATGVDLKLAPKLYKDNCKIDFNQSVEDVHNFVRGLSPYPAAWTEIIFPGHIDPVICKIYKTKKEFCSHSLQAGTPQTDGKTYVKVAGKDGFIHLVEIQMPGKKRMEIGAFLRGLR